MSWADWSAPATTRCTWTSAKASAIHRCSPASFPSRASWRSAFVAVKRSSARNSSAWSTATIPTDNVWRTASWPRWTCDSRNRPSVDVTNVATLLVRCCRQIDWPNEWTITDDIITIKYWHASFQKDTKVIFMGKKENGLIFEWKYEFYRQIYFT